MRNRIQEIKAKGFNIVQGSMDTDYREGYSGYQQPQIDFSKIKIGAKTLDDAVLNLSTYHKVNPKLADKHTILKAIDTYDLAKMREISDFFYKTSGIYGRIIRYMAFMYRYDWYVAPKVKDKKMKSERIEEGFWKCLDTLDDFGVKKTLGEIALNVLKYGCYYGYKVETATGVVLQELPINYCRSRFKYGKKPAVEFNMKFFDDHFRDTAQKMKILKLFPPEFDKGYSLYKKGKLLPEFPGDDSGWYLLDPEMTVKFTANGEDYPAFISAIPLILDLDEAQEMDKKKTMQRLLKIVIQKMPMDKNGDLIFDVDEAQQLHNNAVQMLGKAIGVDVLTTFADVAVEDLADTTAASSQSDDLQRVERQVYNEVGVSQNQFNASGNLALTNSILNDASTMYNLLLQFELFLNELVDKYNTQPKKIKYIVQLLPTTIYNYQELAKLYKEQTQLGHSKLLPQIALGQSQSSILCNAYFENDVLDLVNVFIPPLMSSTMNENILNRVKGGGASNATSSQGGGSTADGDKQVGRKEKSDTEKSEKTIANRESMS